MTIYNMRVIERLWGSRKYAVRLFYFYPSIGWWTDDLCRVLLFSAIASQQS